MVFIKEVLVFLITFSAGQYIKIAYADGSDQINSGFGSLFENAKDEDNQPQRNDSTLCDTRECQIIANEFLRGMNKSVDPCDNLYEFVCGAWEMHNPIPKGELMWNQFNVLQDTVKRRIRDILNTEPQSTDILPVRQAKKWYRACLDIEALENRGIKPIEAILLQVGGWPMTLDSEEWNENEHSWQTVEHDYFHITGSYVFYDIAKWYEDDFGILMAKGNIPLYSMLPTKYRNYTGNDYETYVALITETTEMFVDFNKAAVTKEVIDRDVRDLVEFEKQLYLLRRFCEDENDDVWTVASFVEWYNANMTEASADGEPQKIDFANLIRRQFDLINRKILDSDKMFVDFDVYYVELTKLLNKTPTRTVVNYIHWLFVSEMIVYTTEASRNVFFKLKQEQFDISERQPRWLECIDEVEMKSAAAYAFVKKYFTQEVEDAARVMIEQVRQEMIEQVNGSNWMDQETKKLAQDKLKSMTVFVGFPDWYKNETSVMNSYRGLTIGYDHFDNILSYRKYRVKKSLQYREELSFSTDLNSWINPLVVNAFYIPWDNIIVLPAALFQPPLFTSRVPPSVNYGIIGLVIGHEMGHGFDVGAIQIGRDSDETGISEQMLAIYNERAECFVEQFNQYFGVTENPDSEDESRGRMTRPDNVADSTGLHAVSRAFKKLREKNLVINYQLPGFENYTDDQMFFISFAAMWCESMNPKFAEKLAEGDGHSPNALRVIGAVSNTNDFAEAFNCPVGSPMNPDNKCNVWQSPQPFVAVDASALPKRRRRLGWIRRP